MVAALFGLLTGFVWRRVPALALRLPAQRAALLAGCLAAFFYVLLAGFAVPAQRTLYMLLVAALAMSSGRVIAPSRTLLLALLVVLLIDPWAVLAAGFWLSFGAVGALLYVGSAVVGEADGWRARIRSWGVVQWAATLASLPVLLLVFQQFSLVSPLANAVAIPVVSFVITPLALLAAVIPWWPIAALAHAVLGWLMLFLEWCATWPVWQAPAPPLWAAVVAGIGVAVCLLPRGMPGRLLGVALLLPAIFWPVARPPEGEAWITVLDVGQGLATVVRTREHTLIYDPGPLYSAESDAGQRVVVPYLRSLRAEMERIFSKCWLYVGHDSEGSAAPDQFVTRKVADRSVIFLRDRAGEVRCFLNICPPSWRADLPASRGQRGTFTCMLSWLDVREHRTERLRIAEPETYPPDFNAPGRNDLVPVPRFEQYRGFWFLNFDAGAVSLSELLGSAPATTSM